MDPPLIFVFVQCEATINALFLGVVSKLGMQEV